MILALQTNNIVISGKLIDRAAFQSHETTALKILSLIHSRQITHFAQLKMLMIWIN